MSGEQMNRSSLIFLQFGQFLDIVLCHLAFATPCSAYRALRLLYTGLLLLRVLNYESIVIFPIYEH